MSEIQLVDGQKRTGIGMRKRVDEGTLFPGDLQLYGLHICLLMHCTL